MSKSICEMVRRPSRFLTTACGSTRVEFDPHGRFVLYAFRQPAADHELGQEAQELPFQVFRLGT